MTLSSETIVFKRVVFLFDRTEIVLECFCLKINMKRDGHISHQYAPKSFIYVHLVLEQIASRCWIIEQMWYTIRMEKEAS